MCCQPCLALQAILGAPWRWHYVADISTSLFHTSGVFIPKLFLLFLQADAASLAGSDQSIYTSYVPASSSTQYYSPSRPQHMQQATPYPTTPQQTFPGQYATPYHNSDGSSQASSGDHQYAPQQYQSVGHQGGQYAGLFAAAPDQVSSLQAELAKKKQRIAELQHEVDTTESHRRQVQAHNFELQEQLDQMQQMFQVSLLVLVCPVLSCCDV